jgi:hypothetical protein
MAIVMISIIDRLQNLAVNFPGDRLKFILVSFISIDRLNRSADNLYPYRLTRMRTYWHLSLAFVPLSRVQLASHRRGFANRTNPFSKLGWNT